MTKRKHLKRQVRERSAKTGESYTSALRHLRVETEEKPMTTTTDHVEQTIDCTFCSKTNKEVKKLIAGPGVYICDECVGLCNEILGEETTSMPAPLPHEAPVEVLLPIFRGMAATARSMDKKLGEWAKALAQRGVALSTIAESTNLDPRDAAERFGI